MKLQAQIDERKKELAIQAHRLSAAASRQLKLTDIKLEEVDGVTVSCSYHPMARLMILHVGGAVSEDHAKETLHRWTTQHRKEDPEPT